MGRAEQDRAEKVSAVILVAFGLFVAWYSHHYLKLGMMIMPGAGFMPFYIGLIIAALGVAWYAKVVLARPEPSGVVDGTAAAAAAGTAAEEAGRSMIFARLIPGILLVVAYAWLFERAGYILSTLLFMAGWQKAVEREGWAKTAIVSVVSAAVMYALFARILKVFLPPGTWWE